MKIFLVAGEPSGDKLGAALMDGLKSLTPVEFSGVGGPLMKAQGMESLFPMQELSIMGLAEVLPKYFHLKRRIRETAEAVLASGAQALVTIDSPDFCLRVAAIVKKARPEFKTIHYVAPSVWAWRPKRADKMAKVIDHVLALLPFEPPYMTAAGMSCDFVGHPVVAEPVASAQDALAFRYAHGIPEKAPLLLVLPGSRRGELAKLLPPFGETVARLAEAFPDLQVILPTPSHLYDHVVEETLTWAIKPVVFSPDLTSRIAAFAAADAALAASGTVSLELAAQNCPMVIGYDMAPLTMFLMKRMALIDTVNLVNLVSDTRDIREFLGKDCHADNLAPAVAALLKSGLGLQGEAMRLTMERLGRGGEAPGLRAARSVLAQL